MDRFGNAVTNLPGAWLREDRRWRVAVGDHVTERLCVTYAAVPSGQALAVIGSTGLMEIVISFRRPETVASSGLGGT